MPEPLSLAPEIAHLRGLLETLREGDDDEARKARSALVADTARLISLLIEAMEAERDLFPPDADDSTDTALHAAIARALDELEGSAEC